jgi:hypothetical protein
VHGRETRATRRERSIKSAELLLLEELMVKLGMFSGPRTRGRKPTAYWEVEIVRIVIDSTTRDVTCVV